MSNMKERVPQFNLRIPQELKDKVNNACKLSGRSFTKEVLYRIQRTFDEEARALKRYNDVQENAVGEEGSDREFLLYIITKAIDEHLKTYRK